MGAALPFLMIQAAWAHAMKLGVKKAELSWILEDNKGISDIIESLSGAVYKTYRIYKKDLI